jgi:hypothetical protein
MEDRHTEGLYLELRNGTAADLEGRAAVLAERPGVQQVTWWENCHPHRDDLPRKVDEGSMLAVAEVDRTFEAPEPPSGAAAHLFHRHSRPSQGILDGCPTTGLLIVWITPRAPELAQQLRDWGDFVHIRHIAAAGIPGFTQISVYENTAGDPRYMHFYEFSSDDPEATFKTMTPNVAPRLGGIDSEAYADWADWRAHGGRLFYCNTFRLIGTTGTTGTTTAP